MFFLPSSCLVGFLITLYQDTDPVLQGSLPQISSTARNCQSVDYGCIWHAFDKLAMSSLNVKNRKFFFCKSNFIGLITKSHRKSVPQTILVTLKVTTLPPLLSPLNQDITYPQYLKRGKPGGSF